MKFALRILTALLLIPAILHGGNALAACSNPSGVEGQIIHNDTSNVPQYCDDTNWIAMTGADPSLSDGDYIPNAVNFDGSTYLLRGDDLTGVSDSKTITGSFWLKIDSTANRPILQTLNNNFILRTISGIVTLTINNPAGTRVVGVYLATDLVTDEWNHIMFSIDTSDTASMRRYVNGVEFTGSIFAPNPFIDDVFDLTSGEYAVGSNPTAISVLEGDIADFWIDFDTFIDLSVQANREKFLNTSGNPVFLGNNGNIPTGSAPDIFLSGDTDNWHTNKASGGGFTENGALTTSLTNPYTQITKIVPDGLVGHWRLDETSGTIAADSSGNGNDGIYAANATTQTIDGPVKSAILLPGDSAAITIPSSPSLDGLTALTVCFWQKNGPSGSSSTAGWIRKTGSFEIRGQRAGLGGRHNTPGFRNGDFTGFTFSHTDWHHRCMVRDNNQNDFFINGQLSNGTGASVGTTVTTSDTGNDITIGNNTYNTNFDDIRIYNRALTAAEIAEIYAARDGIRYNESHRTPEYFDGNKFVSLRPNFPEPGNDNIAYDITNVTLGCPNVGDTCSDGSIYAGLSLDGNEIMFATAVDAPSSLAFETGGAPSEDVLPGDCVSLSFTNAAGTCATGELNTQTFAALSSGGAPAPYLAIDYCNNLDVHGHDSWYLPSQSELGTLNTAKNTGSFNGTFNETGVWYWSSSERDAARSRAIDFSGSGIVSASKTATGEVRCVRKGIVPFTSTAGLVGHWKLDETSGTTAENSISTTDLPAINATIDELTTSGAVGPAMHFNGVDERLYLDNGSAIPEGDIFTNGGSVSLWMKPNEQDSSLVINSISWTIRLRTGSSSESGLWFTKTFTGATGNWRSSTTTPAITYNQWSHIIINYDSSSTANDPEIYINGTLAAALPEIVSPVGTTSGEGDGRIAIGGAITGLNSFFQGSIDDIRLYDRVLTTSEITQLYAMGAPVGTSTALPQGCPNIGDVCDDGTVYVGTHDNGELVFTTTDYTENSLPWNNGNTSGFVAIPTTNINNGKDNTDLIITTDSDSVTAGFQPHQGAQHCYDLNKNGADDWFLPDFQLASSMCNNSSIIPNANSGFMASSDTGSPDSSYDGVFPTCGSGNFAKQLFNSIRCVRQGPAPRCANPYGLEGQIIYNNTHNVAQYCDGARWISLGKDG